MTDFNDKIGLVELLDRALNKGVLLNADLIITVADVPLLAANLRLVLASVETMMKFGIMDDWLVPVTLNKEGKHLNPGLLTSESGVKQVTSSTH